MILEQSPLSHLVVISTEYSKCKLRLMPDDPEHGELHSPEDTLNKNNSNSMSSTQYQPYQRLQRKKEKLEHKKKEKQVRTKSMWYSR